MVEIKMVNSQSPMLFTSPDYELVVMPMLAGDSKPGLRSRDVVVTCSYENVKYVTTKLKLIDFMFMVRPTESK